MKRHQIIVIVCVLFLSACSQETTYDPEEIAKESEKANAFFDKAFNESVDRSPMSQSYLGIKEDYDKWDDISDANAKLELEINKEELQFLKDSINPDKLDTQTKISYELFKTSAENAMADFKFRFHNYPVNQMFGMHSRIPSFLINIHQVTSKSDAKAYVSRLNGVEELFDQLVEELKIREGQGIIPPKFVFPMVIEDSQNVLKGAPFEDEAPSTLLEDFQNKLEGLELEQDEKDSLINAAKEGLINSVKPGYEKLIAYLQDQEARATTDDGAWKFPDGGAFYDNALARTTTTKLTAEQIHEIGLKEVERIHNEMREIMKKVSFDGDLTAFLQFMKNDDQFYYPNTEEGKKLYLDSAVAIIDNMKSRLDELFITKPKADIEVKKVEAFREQSAGSAFYQSPAPDGSRPGRYYVNLADTKNQPKFEMEALAYHEGIPGHHMQRSIALELTGLPEFRKYGGYTAYTEGWGLYCEFIPKEMGLYENPYSDYGRLAMEIWRACRLVVDTGIHLKKWTREEALEYYLTNTSGSDRECRRMVERHIVMPSQATAYKIGQLKILELREMALSKLGDQFDIREFHDVVITNGAIPLDVLEQLVNEWIESKLG